MKQGKDGWLELDTTEGRGDLSDAAVVAYQDYKTCYRKAQEYKAQYEAAMLAQFRDAGLAESKALVFGYNFGKASVKIVNAGEVRKQARQESKPQQTLADFLANQR